MITEDLALKNIIMEHDFSYFVTIQPKRVIGLNLAKTLFHGVLRSINEKKKSKLTSNLLEQNPAGPDEQKVVDG